jgi:mono/diheme cytochrome c family protein
MLNFSMKTAWMWACGIHLALLVAGCGPQEAPQFSPSQEWRALIDLAEDDEDRKHWQQLQAQIESELSSRCGTPWSPIVFGDADADRARLRRGAQVFAYRCQQCHGVDGNGRGAVAEYLNPKPRDYTKGIFKFTSTPYGAKPRRADLVRTLGRGVAGTSMPAFNDLAPDDLQAVVDYVIFLAQRGEYEHELVFLAEDEGELDTEVMQEIVDGILAQWQEAQSQLVMPLTPMPRMTADTITKGHDLYLQQVCNKCHGLDGRGGIAGNIEIGKDSWGEDAAAADLTSGMFRGGGRPIDLYRRIHSGINGTPMPGFSTAFANEPDNVWYLVHFVSDLGERRRRNVPPGVGPTSGQSPTAASAASPADESDTTSTTADESGVRESPFGESLGANGG